MGLIAWLPHPSPYIFAFWTSEVESCRNRASLHSNWAQELVGLHWPRPLPKTVLSLFANMHTSTVPILCRCCMSWRQASHWLGGLRSKTPECPIWTSRIAREVNTSWAHGFHQIALRLQLSWYDAAPASKDWFIPWGVHCFYRIPVACISTASERGPTLPRFNLRLHFHHGKEDHEDYRPSFWCSKASYRIVWFGRWHSNPPRTFRSLVAWRECLRWLLWCNSHLVSLFAVWFPRLNLRRCNSRDYRIPRPDVTCIWMTGPDVPNNKAWPDLMSNSTLLSLLPHGTHGRNSSGHMWAGPQRDRTETEYEYSIQNRQNQETERKRNEQTEGVKWTEPEHGLSS